MSDDEATLFSLAPEVLPPAATDSRARAMRRNRNRFVVHAAPTQAMSKSPVRFPIPESRTAEAPADLQSVVDWFYAQPDARERFRWALRDSVDELMDGQRTGRWCYQHLSKTEKTYLGTAVEVNLTKEFDVAGGDDLDWKVAGADLDCKFSKDLGGWEIPMEMYLCADHGEQSGKADHPALLTWFDDDRSMWAAGLLRISDDRLHWKVPTAGAGRVRGYNRDNKRKISATALGEIFWLWGGVQRDLPTNLLLHLPSASRERILGAGSGQQRVNQLFREVTGRIIGRNTILTVGQQDDAPKRARDARDQLRPEGYVVLGHQEAHPMLARLLGLTVPVKGEWISTKLTSVDRSDPRPKALVDFRWWSVAGTGDLRVEAPMLPRHALPPQTDNS
jgi:hypothetical protein